jgi:hypothetical protein
MDALVTGLSQIWTTLSGISVLWAILAVLFALAIYFLPTILAAVVGNTSGRVVVIGVLNLLFAWTGLGWFALIGWAILGRPRDPDEDLELSPFIRSGTG